MRRIVLLTVAVLVIGGAAFAQKNKTQAVSAPDASKVARHYWILKNGGVIEMVCKDPCSNATSEEIHTYMDEVAKQFEKGVFDAETAGLSKAPEAAITSMKKLRNDISFAAGSSSDTGWSVRLLSIKPEAVSAIHDFLKFQIAERQTGDSTEVQ